MMIMDIPDWGWCPWWRFGWSAYALRKLCLKVDWNLLSLKASRSPSKIDDIVAELAGVNDDYGHPWLGLVSLMTLWMVCICPEEAKLKIWLKSVEFEGIKITLKDQWHCCSCCQSLMIRDIPDWGGCPSWPFGRSSCAQSELGLKFGWNMLSLKASRSPSKINDIGAVVAGIYNDYSHSWRGLVSLMTFWMVCICPQ